MKKLRITVGEKVYEVMVEILDEGQETPTPVTGTQITGTAVSAAPSSSDAPTAPKAIPSPSGGDVTSPLAGKLVALNVQPGAEVKQGDQLLTIEAMKMNTYVYAPQNGKISELLANIGDAVQEGQILLHIT